MVKLSVIHSVLLSAVIFGVLMAIFTMVFPRNIIAETLHDQSLGEIIKQEVPKSIPQIDTDIEAGEMEINGDRLYVSNSEPETISVISTENNTKIKDIEVGGFPSVIKSDESESGARLYVAKGSNNISVISTDNDTKIKDIEVGGSTEDIEVVSSLNKVYVSDSNSVSVISADNDTKLKDIVVKAMPTDQVMPTDLEETYEDKLYVATSDPETKNDTISVISTLNDTKIKDIEVGNNPQVLAFEHFSDDEGINERGRMYVANWGSDFISVISTDNDTKIKDIEVGGSPEDIEVVSFLTDDYDNVNKVYVSVPDSNAVSVISADNDTIIKDIEVGDRPEQMIDYYDEKVYVHNSGSDTISVLSAENDTKIGQDIEVAVGAWDMIVKPEDTAVYISNHDDGGVSIIDGSADKIVARVSFAVNPSNGGQITCSKNMTSPLNQYIYVNAGTECKAEPIKGYEFGSWVEDLGSNSTRTMKPSTDEDNILKSFLDFFNIKTGDPAAALEVTEFGNFTANFNKLPPPIPSEYLIPLYGIIITTIVGWSIPSLIGWFRAKMDSRKMNQYHVKIASLYDDGKLDEDDIEALDKLRMDVLDVYSKGKISELHYESLKNEISVLYDEILKKRIDSLQGLSGKDKERIYVEIKDEIEDSYSKGKISELHYKLLNEKIGKIISKNDASE